MLIGFDFDVIQRSAPYLFREGMTFTLTLTAMAMSGGIVFGTLLAMMRLSSYRVLNVPAAGYVNLMRSVPLVLVIFWFYFLVPFIAAWAIGADRPVQVGAFLSSVITFTLFEAFTAATVIYLITNLLVVLMMRALERKVRVPGLIAAGNAPQAGH